VVGTPLHCPRLIERDAELGALVRFAAAAAGGTPSIVFVSGEAGMGKTRLLDELRAQLQRRAAVAAVACPAFAPASLGPIYSLLAALAPEAASADPASGSEAPEAGQLQVFARLLDGLRAAAARKPVVAIIDDAHWADTATLEFLKFAARALVDDRLMFVVAYRPEEVGTSADLERVVAQVTRSPLARNVILQALSGEGVAEFIEATLGDTTLPDAPSLRSVRERCEGNPLFVEELLKSALESEGNPTPSTLRSLVAARMAGMTSDERNLLETAALIGRRFSVAFLEKIAGDRSRQLVLAFLRQAVAAHFLVEDRVEPGWFQFRHALVRDAILAPILLLESRELHLTIGRALEREPDADDRVAELSEHFWLAGAKADSGPYARLAGERAMTRFAYREAAEQFERALLCEPADADRAALREGAASAYYELGNNAEATRHQEILLELARATGERGRIVDAMLVLANLKHQAHDHAVSLELLDEAQTRERDAPDDRLRIRILAQRAVLLAIQGEWPAVERALAEAEPLLELAGLRDQIRLYNARSGLRFFHERNYEAGMEESLAAVRCAHETGRPVSIILAMTNYAFLVGRVLPVTPTIAAYEDALAFTEGYGDLFQAVLTRGYFAHALIDAGRLDGAHARLWILLAEKAQAPVVEMVIARLAARLAAYLRDDTLVKRADCAGALGRAGSGGRTVGFWCQLASALADAHAATGDLESARRVLGRLLDDGTFADQEGPGSTVLPSIAALGDRALVDAVTAVAAHWRSYENPRVRTHVELFDAYAESRFGSEKAARRHAATAVDGFAALEMPLLEAEAHVLAGNRARAAALMKSCGARRLARQADTGADASERSKPLSRREREIADLAAAGHSNKTIAERLFVSERTIESHLANAYVKLGVSSRAALGAALDESA